MIKKSRVFMMIILSLILVLSTNSIVGAYTLEITDYRVDITNTGNHLKVTEDIKLKNKNSDGATLLDFWIQKESQDPITILSVDHNVKLAPIIRGYTYTCNLTLYNISIKKDEILHISITYNLPTTTTNYEKRLTYNTNTIMVNLDDRIIGRFESLTSDASLSLPLYKPAEPPVHPLYLIFIFLLVVLIILVMLLILRRQRSKTKKEDVLESDEILNFKKTLLLLILKEIEKQYRAKEISEDTYNKIKEEYKQQAVEVMKKIEDRKKKIEDRKTKI
ncbi:MAG: hypothetical protein QXS02_04310 [Candidatus Thermoplasmatota archaeon]